uniref:Uncharacterized protein n=1 Tax=Romanomermis culicivorax TaxID=13658 RepID=A0A915IPF5_ROMCU
MYSDFDFQLQYQLNKPTISKKQCNKVVLQKKMELLPPPQCVRPGYWIKLSVGLFFVDGRGNNFFAVNAINAIETVVLL